MKHNKFIVFATASSVVVGSAFAFMLFTKGNNFVLAKAKSKEISFSKSLVTNNPTVFQNDGGTYSYNQPFERSIPTGQGSDIDVKIYARGKVVSGKDNPPAASAERTYTGFCFGNNDAFVSGYQDKVYDAQICIEVGINNITGYDVSYTLGDFTENDTNSSFFNLTVTLFDINGDQIGEPAVFDDGDTAGRLSGISWSKNMFPDLPEIHKMTFVFDANNYVSPIEPIYVNEMNFYWSC